MPFNKNTIDQIRNDIEQALEAVARKHNLCLALGNITYYSDRFSAKIEGRDVNAPSKEAQMYEVNRERYGLPPLGAKVVLSGKELTIAGMTPRGKVLLMQGEKEYTAEIGMVVRSAPKQPPKSSLDEFVAAVNKLWAAEGTFAPPLPAQMIETYHRSGMTPEATIAVIEENNRREMRAEARAS